MFGVPSTLGAAAAPFGTAVPFRGKPSCADAASPSSAQPHSPASGRAAASAAPPGAATDALEGCADSLEAFVSLGLRFTKTRTVEGGLRVRAGQTVAVNYTCRLGGAKGHVLDASAVGAPLSVRAGRAAVVPGWDLALLRMCVGEVAALELPPSLAYGSKGNAKVPPASRLHFELEVSSAQP